MVEQVTFQTLFQFLQTVALIVGVYYYITTIRTNQKNQELQLETRQAQLFMQIYSRMHDHSFIKMVNSMHDWEWKDFDDFMEKYRSNNEEWAKVGAVGMFYEGIGVLIKRGLIDPSFVDDLMSGSIIGFWEKIGPLALEHRERYDFPQGYEYVEYLYNVIKGIVDDQHPETKI